MNEISPTVEPKKFYNGKLLVSVLMEQAYIDLGCCHDIEKIKLIFGVPCFGLLARIRRHADARNLIHPEQINYEKYPFQAIKYTYCADWNSFRLNNGNISELLHLRAYFWEEKTLYEQLMCITHFNLKTQEKLAPDDANKSHEQRDKFLKNGRYYCED